VRRLFLEGGERIEAAGVTVLPPTNAAAFSESARRGRDVWFTLVTLDTVPGIMWWDVIYPTGKVWG